MGAKTVSMSLDEIGGWFPAENRAELEKLIVENEVKSVLEIGSFLGLSAAWFAQRVERVTCVDRWHEPASHDSGNNLNATLRRFGIPRDFYEIFMSNMREFGVANKVFPVRGDSTAVHGSIGDHDLVYVDGDHSLEGCRLDLKFYGPKAKRVLCGDDFLPRPEFGVIEAVEEYAKKISVTLHVQVPFWWMDKR